MTLLLQQLMMSKELRSYEVSYIEQFDRAAQLVHVKFVRPMRLRNDKLIIVYPDLPLL